VTVKLGASAPLAPFSIAYALIHGTCDIAGCVQEVSQTQPVQPVAIHVSMIDIALLYF